MIKHSMTHGLVAGLALTCIGGAFAADPNQGRNLAATCANCHGTNGKSAGGTESLAGLPKDKIVQNMKDFASGDKPATVMHQLAKGFSATQIEAMASFFAAQK
jgi:cytochrome c553